MGENLLSGYAYFPPIETTIVPRVEASLATANSPRFRRKARSRLGPHFGVVYPRPPAGVTDLLQTQAAVRAARRLERREPLSVLRPPRYIVYSVVGPVKPDLDVTLAAVRGSLAPGSRRPMSVLRPPRYIVYQVVAPVKATLDVTLVSVGAALARERRRAFSRLYPHRGVVYPLPAAGVTDLLGAQTAVRASLVVRPHASYVLGSPVSTTATPHPMLGGVMVVLVQQPRQVMLSSRLSPPTVVNP